MSEQRIKDLIESRLKDLEPQLIELRREFHRFPEVSYQEAETSIRIQNRLQSYGIPFEVIEHNIVIARIEGNAPGATLGIRADIDALPMQEENDELPYRSENPGVMHSCGHDAHIAMLLGAGKVIHEISNQLAGTVVLIFQAAEEVAGGVEEISRCIDAQGGLNRLIAIHVWSDLPSGHISIEAGGRMAGGIFWETEIRGQGGHGSRPDLAKDPVKPACEILLQAAALPTSKYTMLDPCVVSPTMIQGSTALNIIPDTAKIGGTIRHFSYKGGETLSNYLEQLAENIAVAHGVSASTRFFGHVSPTVNDKAAAELGQKVARDVKGLKLDAFEPICGCDCFGDLLKRYPGVYCYLGVRSEEKDTVYPQHHARYNIDEDMLRLGSVFFAKYAYAYLGV